MSTVLRAFDYSFDGVTALKAKVGEDINFGDMTSGLVAEGYVAAVEPAPTADIAPVMEESAQQAPPEPDLGSEGDAPDVEPETVATPAVQPEPKRKRK